MGIESITGSFGFVHGSLIVLIITYQRASTRPVELLKEEIAFRPSIHVIDALERVQDEKHDTTNINDIHHNKVDTSDIFFLSFIKSREVEVGNYSVDILT